MLDVYDSVSASSHVIPIRSAVYPLTISWNVRTQGREFVLDDGTSAGKSMVGTGEATISNPGIVRLVVETRSTSAPAEFGLQQNYPNPFTPSTEIRFTVDHQTSTTLEVFNVLGEHVATLFHDVAQGGQVLHGDIRRVEPRERDLLLPTAGRTKTTGAVTVASQMNGPTNGRRKTAVMRGLNHGY